MLRLLVGRLRMFICKKRLDYAIENGSPRDILRARYFYDAACKQKKSAEEELYGCDG